MGELLKFARYRTAHRVICAIEGVTMNVIREALVEAENTLLIMKALQNFNPNWVDDQGNTIDAHVAEQLAKISDLKSDLMGEC
jgi:hypothetical protein